jgi:hypothetical protein
MKKMMCPKCGQEAKPLPGGRYESDETVYVFDNEKNRVYSCCDQAFGAPVGSANANSKLKSFDEALK